MNVQTPVLKPAAEVARVAPTRIPNESAEYRAARTALLAEEIELRRHIERVAAQRRALPQGAPVTGDYRFEGEEGPVDFARPVRRQADARDLQLHVRAAARASLSDVHQSPGRVGRQCGGHRSEGVAGGRRALADRAPDRLEEGARMAKPAPLQRSQRRLFARLFRAIAADGSDEPALNVFTRRDGAIRHFWSAEMSGTSDPGQDPRGAPDPAPLWMVLDMTPEGRGADWYPKLDYV